MKRSIIVATAIASLVVPILAPAGQALAQERPNRQAEMSREQARRPDPSGSMRPAPQRREARQERRQLLNVVKRRTRRENAQRNAQPSHAQPLQEPVNSAQKDVHYDA